MSDSKLSKMIPISSGKLLAKNTIWNLLGQGLPIVAAIFSIPLLIKGMGVDRFGILTLAWMVIGYFSLFDFGIGRALTKIIAECLGKGETEKIHVIVWTTLLFMLLLGLLGSGVLTLLTPWLVNRVLKIPQELINETSDSFYLLALSIPIVINTTALRGVLEAYQRFDLVNIVRIPLALFMLLGPLAVLLYTKSLLAIVAVLLAGRLLVWIVHLAFCLSVVPNLKTKITAKFELLKPLFVFGGWMTASNLVGPFLIYFDRFLIGSITSMAAVAYYTTPQEIVTKLLIVPAALTGVLFPAFASALAHEKARAITLFERGNNYIFILLLPATLFIITFAPEGMALWIGEEFSLQSATPLRWLAMGVFFNSLVQVPSALIQAAGRPDITAKIYVTELVLYVPVLYWLILKYGIDGAAVAWMLRSLADALIMFWIAGRIIPCSTHLAQMLIYMAYGVGLMAAGWLLDGMAMKIVFTLIVWTLLVLHAWKNIFDEKEHSFILGLFKKKSDSN